MVEELACESRLTRAEARVIRAAVVSSNYKVIAEMIGRSVETVRRHLSSIRAKTGRYVDELVRPIREATIRW